MLVHIAAYFARTNLHLGHVLPETQRPVDEVVAPGVAVYEGFFTHLKGSWTRGSPDGIKGRPNRWCHPLPCEFQGVYPGSETWLRRLHVFAAQDAGARSFAQRDAAAAGAMSNSQGPQT